MKEKNFKIIFFTTIIILLIISIYLVIKNKNTYAIETDQIKKEIKIDDNINLGIVKYDTLNPILTKNQDIQYITKLIYKPIIDISEDFKLKKSLAEEWNKLDDKTYLIKLQENIKWNNGNKFTSKDIEYTIDFIKKNQSIYKENIKNIDKIETINDYIIKIYLKEPEENFEYMLSFPVICNIENVGIGNYIIENITEKEIILKSILNKKQITIKVFENIAYLYNAFSKEDIDFFITNNVNYQKYIGAIGHNRKIITGRCFDYLKYNLNNKILKNLEVIQAINLLINKSEINNKIYNNLYCIAEFPMQYGSYLYNGNIKYENNVNKAQKILEDSGWVYNREKLEEKWNSAKITNNNKHTKVTGCKYNKEKSGRDRLRNKSKRN